MGLALPVSFLDMCSIEKINIYGTRPNKRGKNNDNPGQ